NVFPSGVLCLSATGRDLTHQQWGRNLTMEQARAAANHYISGSTKRIRESRPRIEIFQGVVERCTRPGLALPAQAQVERSIVAGPSFVLQVKALVSMIQRPLSLITDGRANCRALVNRRIERGFLEVRGLIEALKEDDEGMRSAHEVGPKKC